MSTTLKNQPGEITMHKPHTDEKQPNRTLRQLTGSQIFVESLIREKVETIFGYPGGVVLSVYDELFKSGKLRHILVRHEQGATHAADGYARATGKTGVVLVTSGPGATNTVTGIATAFADSIPIVVFTGQVTTTTLGNESFQEADITSITRPITKHAFLVRDVNQLAEVIHKAFFIARSGRPGPVLVDMPKDMLLTKTSYHPPSEVSVRNLKSHTPPTQHKLAQAAQMIAESKRPVLYVGGGVVGGNASDEVLALSMKMKAPVTTTLMGMGAISNDYEMNLGMLGMHGTWYANMAVSECDLLIAIGARFDDRITGRTDDFSLKSRKIHIDIDECCVNRAVKVDLPIIGNSKTVLEALLPFVKQCESDHWLERIRFWKKMHPLKYHHSNETIKPQAVIEAVSRATAGDAVIVTDVGQHQMFTAQWYGFKYPRTFITSGGLGTMGFGLPAAIGAAIGQNQRPVICFCGDGGFQMTSMELATAVANKLPVKVIIMNNGYLGMVRQWQELFFEKHYSHSDLRGVSPDFVKLAESYGAAAFRVTRHEDLEAGVSTLLGHKDGPMIMEVTIDWRENVFPMVAAGKALYEMVEGEN